MFIVILLENLTGAFQSIEGIFSTQDKADDFVKKNGKIHIVNNHIMGYRNYDDYYYITEFNGEIDG